MTATQTSPSLAQRWSSYWFEPAPVRRLDAFARVIFAVIALHIVSIDAWVVAHDRVALSMYRPVLLARMVGLPAPTPTTMVALRVLTVLACIAGMWRRAPRLTSGLVLVGNSIWLMWAFSYGKVDHDRLTITIALLALTLTPRRGPDVEAQTGWALRLVQVTFAFAYLFSALVKLRTAGWEWANSAVFTRAIIRRGTELGDLLVNTPLLLRIGQWAFLCFELVAVIVIFRNRWTRTFAIAGILALHSFTYAAIQISFLPHTICVLAFFPLERIGDRWAELRARRTARSRSQPEHPHGVVA